MPYETQVKTRGDVAQRAAQAIGQDDIGALIDTLLASLGG